MEVKIGVQFVTRELVLESNQTAQEIEAAVGTALADPAGVLTLVDDKGRRVIIPSAKLAFVEVAESEPRRVGFGAL